MSNELQLSYLVSQNTYVLVRNGAGQVCSGTTMVTFDAGDIGDYDIPLTDRGGGFYTGDFPALPAGNYYIEYFAQTGGSPSATADIKLDSRRFEWSGTAELGLSNITVTGMGAYTISLQVRTTGGAAIPNVMVWVTAASDGSGDVLAQGTTGLTGLLDIKLDAGTFYVTCLKAGYSFLANAVNNRIVVSTSATKTLDIGTSMATGAAAIYAESFLSRAIADLRENVDEPSIKAKYSDARCIRKIEEAYALVLGEVQRISVTSVVARYEVTVVSGQETYPLPATIGSIKAIYEKAESGYKIFYSTFSRYNQRGRGVWLEGKTLHVQDGYLGAGTVITVEYEGTAPRLCNGVCTVDSTGLLVTLGALYQGTLDTRINAYGGSVLRIIGDSDAAYNYMQERPIKSYDATTHIVTLEEALSPNNTSSTGTTYFEIAPPINILMDSVVPLRAAVDIAAREGATTRSQLLRRSYQDCLRNVQLTEFYSDLQNNLRMPADNYNHRRFRQGNLWR